MVRIWISILALAFAAAATGQAPASDKARAEDIRVTLLGTGTPVLNIDRFGMSTLVQAGGQTLLFDVGRGATMRLHQAKVALGQIDAIFITHLHSDHIAGLPDVYATAPLLPPGRSLPFDIWGPSGIDDVGRGIELMFRANNRIRAGERGAGHHPSEPGVTQVSTHELPADGGVVFRKDGVIVTAFLVDHGNVKPAYGYRVDYRGRSVVLSGDTLYTPNLIKHAKGADLLVQCVAVGSRRLEAAAPELVRPRYAHLSNPEMAARILSEARPKQTALSHISLLSRPGIPRVSDKELRTRISALYDGPYVIGEDLMSFRVTASGVFAEPYTDTKRHAEPE